MKKNLCIIPARGGSKRIPRKNIKPFLGKPIIVYSIEAAIESKLFEEIMVSTDDQEIAKVAREYGANVPFYRSKENADDYTGLNEVIHEVLHVYKEKLNRTFQAVACLLPTSPLLKVEQLIRAYDILINKDYKSVTPVVAYSYPIMRSLKFDDDNTLKMIWPEYLDTRSQDLPKAFHDAGMFYWIDYDNFFKERKLFSERGTGIVLDENAVQDIDSETDWKLAELKYQLLLG